MITLFALERSFGPVHAVRGVTLDIPTGQVVGILGPNGAGKTTTVRMICGAIPPSAGSATVDGLDSVADTLALRARVGYLPESAPLYREMRVGDYLAYRARLYGVPRRRRSSAIGASVERCQLADVRRRRIGALSKGYRQRVGLASVLLHDPPLLILDEPTSGLDPAQIAQTRALIRDLSGQRTTLVVSHILPEVERTCDRIIVFLNGRVRADASPSELVRALPGAGTLIVEARGTPGGPSPAQALGSLPGVRGVEVSDLDEGWQRLIIACAPEVGDGREMVARAAAGAGLMVRELRAGSPSLEDAYLALRTATEQESQGAS